MELKHQNTGVSVGELTESLSALSDELQDLKEKMDSKGDAVSGSSTAWDERRSMYDEAVLVVRFLLFCCPSRPPLSFLQQNIAPMGTCCAKLGAVST